MLSPVLMLSYTNRTTPVVLNVKKMDMISYNAELLPKQKYIKIIRYNKISSYLVKKKSLTKISPPRHLPCFGRWSAAVLRKGAFQTMLTLSSPPWCIPHHHPGSRHPSSGSLQRTGPLCLCAQPASPRGGESKDRIDGTYKEGILINIQNLHGTQLLSCL